MESSLSVCKDPQAEQNRDTERPKQDVAETQRDRRERSTEGDTLRRETGSQRGEQRDPERETERQRQRDREIEILRKSSETAKISRLRAKGETKTRRIRSESAWWPPSAPTRLRPFKPHPHRSSSLRPRPIRRPRAPPARLTSAPRQELSAPPVLNQDGRRRRPGPGVS